MPLLMTFADSELASATLAGGQLRLRLSAAAVQRVVAPSLPVHGHVASVIVVLGGAVVDGPLNAPVGRIAGGSVEVGGQPLARLTLPFQARGPIRLTLDLPHRTVLSAHGNSLECQVDGDLRFTESLAC